MTRLRYTVHVDVDRPTSHKAIIKEWERTAKRIKRAAQGRSKTRVVFVGPGRI